MSAAGGDLALRRMLVDCLSPRSDGGKLSELLTFSLLVNSMWLLAISAVDLDVVAVSVLLLLLLCKVRFDVCMVDWLRRLLWIDSIFCKSVLVLARLLLILLERRKMFELALGALDEEDETGTAVFVLVGP